jgi:pyruvate dehydrogenase E2 component (dihydrolipoyllysine-residue acetyltransferase)
MAEIVKMPKLGFDMAEGTLVRWVVNEGDHVIKGAVLAEIETDKATVEVETTYDGVLLRQLVPQGTIVPINDPIAVIGNPGEEVNLDAAMKKPEVADKLKGTEEPSEEVRQQESGVEAISELNVQVPSNSNEAPHASPLARSMAADLGINLRLVQGTGPGGRITKKDIESFQQKKSIPETVKIPGTARMKSEPASITGVRETRSIPLPRLRAAIGRRMTESKQQAPHFYVTHEYDVAALIDRRKEINALLAEEEKLSVNDFIVRAVALTLLEFPNLNASLDSKNSSVIYHGMINIGVAVAVENGLLTIVCRDPDQKTIFQISSELKVLVKRAREGKVRPEDIEGSTFTVSNLGMFDVDEFSAIINPPEAAILAIASVKQVPVVKNNEVNIGTRMKATLSVDHRISDGAEGARFLQALTKYIEEPIRLLVSLS